ncbi:MAG: SMP-30/gluconolactonase/LRE family protein [Sphingobium sp.]
MSDRLAAIRPESILSVGATLGEGPVWVAEDGALWFVDIKAPAVHRFDPSSGMHRYWSAPAQTGWVLPTEGGDFLAGLRTGVHRFDPASGIFTPHHDPEPHLPGNRLNDATVDGAGRVWFSTMDDAEAAETGRVYRMDGAGCADSGAAPVSIANGPALSPDGSILYHVDTLGRAIWRSRVEEDGQLRDTRLFASMEEGAGYPDGPVVDAAGCLWVGLFGGWGVRRYDPSGALMGVVRFPVANVTKIAFGGDGLATAYATTARKGLSEADLAAQPLAGNLFAFDPGVRGQPVPRVRI